MTSPPLKKGLFFLFTERVEILGNKLPHPFFLFLTLAVLSLALSWAFAGSEVSYMAADQSGALKETTVKIVNLLTKESFVETLSDWVKIYTGFAPLGIVMVMMLAIGFAEATGLFSAFMRKTLLGAPSSIITFVLALVCICGNLAANAGIVLGATLGAALFASLGRNPIVGAVAGYASAHGGFTMNLILSGDDVLLASITEAAASSIGLQGAVHVTMNYFFTFVSALGIACCSTFVTEKILPRVMKYEGEKSETREPVSASERRGLSWALVACSFYFIVLVFLTVPQGSVLRNAQGAFLPKSPLMSSIVALIFFFFITVGLAYGFGSGKIRKQSDIPDLMGSGIRGSISFFVIAFPSALFIRFFNASKMANVMAVHGTEFLKNINFTGIPLILVFILFAGCINLFMTSASSKWMILAPVFVPMFAMLGYSPALTQIVYRVSDSAFNPISPINYFLPIVIGIMNQYKGEGEPEVGMGTLISMTLPYTLIFLGWYVLQVVCWMLWNLPLGPGATILLN